MKKQRRSISIFNMSFLDMITNFLGACILLLLLAMRDGGNKPCPSIVRQANVYFDTDRHFLYDTLDLTMRGLKEGDSLLVIIKELKNFTSASSSTGGDYERIPRPGRPDTTDAPIPSPGKCGIGSIVSAPECNDNNTPSNPSDDTYTFSVTLNPVGECGTIWQDQFGRSGQYGNPALYGPFAIKEGLKFLTFKDVGKGGLMANVMVKPPVPCSSGGGIAGGGPVMPPMQGKLNFYLEFDEAAGQRVSIIVEKGSKEVWGRHQADDAIGLWRNGRGPRPTRRTGFEAVTQYTKYLPGTYKVYGRYRRGRSQTANAKLYIGSKDMPAQNQVTQFTLSKGQKTLLQTIEIGVDGSIRIIR